ncbi:MAG: flagellar export protein FliJ [Planctomycetota bacterium]
MFRFKLDPLLELREREERDAQLALAAVQAEADEIEAEITGAQRAINQLKEDLRSVIGVGPVQVRQVGRQAAATLTKRARTQENALRLAEVYRRVEAARGLLVEAAQRRRAVELLKERRLEAFRRAEMKRENEELDDLAARAFRRRRDEDQG